MKKIPQSLDDTLLNYLDGELDAIEAAKLEKEFSHNAMLKGRLEQLKFITSALKETKVGQPSKNFTLNVMNRLDQRSTESGFSFGNGMLLLAGVLAAVGLASVLVSIGAFDSVVINFNQVDIVQKYINIPLPSFQFSGKLIVNIIILLNLGLAWLVLDRVILKPFFERRVQPRH